jgi:hypothetical protein
MKTILIGDIHGRSIWKRIVADEKPDRVIFIGDYFDSFNIPGVTQLRNFEDIVEYQKTAGIEVVMLIGNHDYHYMQSAEHYSGYQPVFHHQFNEALRNNSDNMQVAYQFDDVVCSHAGLSSVWLDNRFGEGQWTVDTMVEQVNELFKYKPQMFYFDGFDASGNSKTQGPFWIRPAALMSANKETIKKQIIQVVGHTQVKGILDSYAASQKAMGGRYYLIDALDDEGYMSYENGEFTPVRMFVS